MIRTMKSRRILVGALICLLSVLLHPANVDQAVAAELLDLSHLDDAPRGARVNFSTTSMSADGSVVGLVEYDGDFSGWIWSKEMGFQQAPVANHTSTHDVSGDGSVVAGTNQDGRFVWNRNTDEVNTIMDMEGDHQLWLSYDGSIAANGRFRWSQVDGVESLGISSDWTSQIASAISADGSTIVGSVSANRIRTPEGNYNLDADGFIWRDGQLIELGLPHTGDPNMLKSQALDVSADGNIVLARAERQLIMLTGNGEEIRNLGSLTLGGNDYDFRDAYITNDNSIVIWAKKITGFTGAVWDDAHGYRYLADILRDEHGLEFPSSTKSMWPDRGFRRRSGNCRHMEAHF